MCAKNIFVILILAFTFKIKTVQTLTNENFKKITRNYYNGIY